MTFFYAKLKNITRILGYILKYFELLFTRKKMGYFKNRCSWKIYIIFLGVYLLNY